MLGVLVSGGVSGGETLLLFLLLVLQFRLLLLLLILLLFLTAIAERRAVSFRLTEWMMQGE